MTITADQELVVLLDEQARPIGTSPKASVHHRETPLHLGFSCYLFDRTGISPWAVAQIPLLEASGVAQWT